MDRASLTSLFTRLACICTLALSFVSQAYAAEKQIDNGLLRLTVSTETDRFTLHAGGDPNAFLKSGRFTHPITSISQRRLTDPVWGHGNEILIVHEGGGHSTLRLYAESPFLQLHTSVHNGEKEPLITSSLETLAMTVDLGLATSELRLYGSGGVHSLDKAPGSFIFSAIVDPDTRSGLVAGFLTHERGSGVFDTAVVDGEINLNTRIDFGHFQVAPSADRQTDTLLIGWFDDARLGLEAYADAVARHYSIQLKPMPGVYCTWYHAGASNEKRIIANSHFTQQHLAPYGLSVMQIDDLWQKRIPADTQFDGNENDLKDGGPVKVFIDANDKFPHGMKYTAEQIASQGLVPGIWFMPFVGNWKNPYFADKQDLFAKNPDGTPFTTRWSGTILDMTNPRSQDFLRQRTKRITDWGYRYFKLDGMHTGAICHNVYVNSGWSDSGTWKNKRDFGTSVLHDPAMTNIQAYRKGLKIVREASASDVFILGCNVSQNMRSMGAAFGLIDAMRIGPDNGGAGRGRWNDVTVGAYHGSNLYFLNRRVWHNDPDPVYVRSGISLDAARVMVSWVAISGNMLTTSYQFAELPPERLDLLKRAMPSHTATARPVDLFETRTARVWLVNNERSQVIGRFNWQEKEPQRIRYDMDKLGLDASRRYVAFDYWADTFVDPLIRTLDQTLPPGSCRILAIRPQTDHPQVVSTSRHITQGVIDLLDESWDANALTLSGKSLVVAGDPYELRIAIPEEGAWKLERLAATDATIVAGQVALQGVRIVIESPTTGEVTWQLRFSKQ